jgi:hypothetical protein
MDLSGLKGKINGILEAVRGIPEKARGLFGKNKEPNTEVSKMPRFFSALLARLSNLFNSAGPDKRKPLLMGFGALAGIFLILVIAAGISSSKKRRTTSPEAAFEGLTIAAEELFIPAEPDFIPEFVFEREKRRFWSLEDIRPYWRTPDPGDRWRDEIKSAVDKLMEGIP